jgi:purine-binding chemotaxis protein CheW
VTSKPDASDVEQEFVTLTLGDQLCGISVHEVRDVLGDQPITSIPLAPPEIAGCVNLRGRIVTVIDVRRQLGLPPATNATGRMSLVAERGGDLYALLVDRVIEVVRLGASRMEPPPPTLQPGWAAFSSGIYRLDRRLLVALDVGRLLAIGGAVH